MIPYAFFADLLVLFHFFYVTFAVGGEFFILAGAFLKMGVVRNFAFRIAHLVAVVFVDITFLTLNGNVEPEGTFLSVTATVSPQHITATSPPTPINNEVSCVNLVTSEGVQTAAFCACSIKAIIIIFVLYYLIEMLTTKIIKINESNNYYNIIQ